MSAFEARWDAAYYAVRARMAERTRLGIGNVCGPRRIQWVEIPNAALNRNPPDSWPIAFRGADAQVQQPAVPYRALDPER